MGILIIPYLFRLIIDGRYLPLLSIFSLDLICMKVKLCNSLFEVANMREQIHTTGQAKLSEKQKWRISVKLTI